MDTSYERYKLAIIDKHRREYTKLRDKYFDEYQNSGSRSSERTYRKYDELTDICGYAYAYVQEEDDEKRRRVSNIRTYIQEQLRHDKYTKQEVIEMLEMIARW